MATIVVIEDTPTPPSPSRAAAERGRDALMGGGEEGRASSSSSKGTVSRAEKTTAERDGPAGATERAWSIPSDGSVGAEEEEEAEVALVGEDVSPSPRARMESGGLGSSSSTEEGRERESVHSDTGRLSDPDPLAGPSTALKPAPPAQDVKKEAKSVSISLDGETTTTKAAKTAETKNASLSAAPATAKPKSTRKRSPSPSPPPPPAPRPPLQTIRLEFRLGGPDNYAVDVTALAKASGQLPASPPAPPPLTLPIENDASESEANDETDTGKAKKKGKAGRKKNLGAEEYDLNDPFIDDSELAIDQRKTFAQTKQQGFYVSSGEVALVKDKSSPQKKPKSKKVIPTIIPLAGSSSLSAAVKAQPANSTTLKNDPFVSPTGDSFLPPITSKTVNGEGSKESPIPIDDAPPPFANELKRKASFDIPSNSSVAGGSTTTSSKKRRKGIEIESFHPDLQVVLHELKAAIAKESFEQKGKFPPGLKPMLVRVALKAISCGEYNDKFFTLMPKMFIYNKFTMRKLIKRTVYSDHQALLTARQDELLMQLKKIADEDYPRAVEEFEKHVSQWEKRQAKAAEGGQGSVETTPAPPGSASATPNVNTTVPLPVPAPQRGDGGDESGMDVDGAPPSTQGPANAHTSRPTKRYRLTEPMRNIIWELVVLSNESVRIENEKNAFEQTVPLTVSEQGARKTLYQKIVQAFPDGWMSSGQISREVSVMKKRYEQQQQEDAS